MADWEAADCGGAHPRAPKPAKSSIQSGAFCRQEQQDGGSIKTGKHFYTEAKTAATKALPDSSEACEMNGYDADDSNDSAPPSGYYQDLTGEDLSSVLDQISLKEKQPEMKTKESILNSRPVWILRLLLLLLIILQQTMVV